MEKDMFRLLISGENGIDLQETRDHPPGRIGTFQQEEVVFLVPVYPHNPIPGMDLEHLRGEFLRAAGNGDGLRNSRRG
jgi:hypothetical protein